MGLLGGVTGVIFKIQSRQAVLICHIVFAEFKSVSCQTISDQAIELLDEYDKFHPMYWHNESMKYTFLRYLKFKNDN